MAKRNPGVRRAPLPDMADYEEKPKAMIVCKAQELGMNQLHED
jgi:hypothetical protein